MGKVQIIILAAGHGKRMGNIDLPKVLVPFRGKAIIKHLLGAIEDSQVCEVPAIVIGQKAEKVRQALGENYSYIYQDQQLGTGHAVICAKDKLEKIAENIMVLYGDHPLITDQTIQKLADEHVKNNSVLTMCTFKIQDFTDWRKPFFDFGRIIRNDKDRLEKIVEKKDASPEEINIKEFNPGYYCFKASWLWENLAELQNNNAQGEYYLTDLVEIARKQGRNIATVEIDPKQALGVNTVEQLAVVEQL